MSDTEDQVKIDIKPLKEDEVFDKKNLKANQNVN